jgi:rhomboid family GlyGly-CTERM serine protease
VTLLGFIGSEFSQWLRYDRTAILSGQLWRIITGHLLHLSWSHLAMNVAGLALIWAIFGKQISILRWLTVLLVSAVGISGFMLVFNPALRWYVGLSGVLHALFMAGCLAEIRHGRWDSKLLLALVITKLGYEQMAGPLPGSERTAGGNVIVDAHLYGAIFGFAVFLMFWLWDRRAPVRKFP